VFTKVLVANRGEIAVRVIRTLHALGIASVAVYSDADAGAPHVRAAGEALRIGPPPAARSYLSAEAIIAAARATGAQAIHPGYGFLAENAAFARACAAAGITFIGPPPEAIEAMGDKIAAKATVSAAGVPVVPGAGAPGMTDQELISSLNDAWFPVLVKPSAGGGGKGMRVARTREELPQALAASRREARAAFGDDTLLAEKYIDRPRHIEIQVLADAHGTVVHLGERECSLQRRHQKVIEEAPSPLLDEARRAAMGAAAVEAARSVGYAGAGTVECIVDGGCPDSFYFMEMNTRLQVEHPVTEMVTGLDLVEWQVRVAAGERLSLGGALRSPGGTPPEPLARTPRGMSDALLPQGTPPGPPANIPDMPTIFPVPLIGHAIEARVYAEDPARGFLPTGGRVLGLSEPSGEHVRVDSGIAPGTVVTSAYDPMLAKVAAWGPDRATALRRLDAALREMTVLGVATNTGFLRTLLADPGVRAGQLDTGLIERLALPPAQVPDEVYASAALLLLLGPGPAGAGGLAPASPWDVPDGWRLGGPAWTRLRLSAGAGAGADVRVRGLASSGAQVTVGDGPALAARAERGPGQLVVWLEGRRLAFQYAVDGQTAWLGRDGQAWAIAAAEAASPRAAAGGPADGTVRSPMPGTVLAVHVTPGETVAAGQRLVVVEAMKMEHAVTAPVAGTVAGLPVKAGQQVRMDETLVVIQGNDPNAVKLAGPFHGMPAPSPLPRAGRLAALAVRRWAPGTAAALCDLAARHLRAPPVPRRGAHPSVHP
jgi:acetyl-CoA/propionyl-CoA carboxylase, biotin carboxylase, biotin carboxyl carrier protein